MTDRVNALVNDMKRTPFKSPLNLPGRELEVEKLLPRHHPMLRLRQIDKPTIPSTTTAPATRAPF